MPRRHEHRNLKLGNPYFVFGKAASRLLWLFYLQDIVEKDGYEA